MLLYVVAILLLLLATCDSVCCGRYRLHQPEADSSWQGFHAVMWARSPNVNLAPAITTAHATNNRAPAMPLLGSPGENSGYQTVMRLGEGLPLMLKIYTCVVVFFAGRATWQ